MSNSSIKPTPTFWIISIIALIWYLLGALAYLEQAYMTEEVLATLPEPEQLYYQNVAPWATAAYATAVFGGVLGCIALFIRNKWASILFALSLIAVIIQSIYNLFIQEFMEIEPKHMILYAVIIAIAISLVWFSKYSAKKGWLS